MEQFDRENQQALDLALTSCQDIDCVLGKVATPGWDWLFYKPYVQLALDKKITLVAANLSNTDVRKVMTQGFSSVYSRLEIAEYKLERALYVIPIEHWVSASEANSQMSLAS